MTDDSSGLATCFTYLGRIAYSDIINATSTAHMSGDDSQILVINQCDNNKLDVEHELGQMDNAIEIDIHSRIEHPKTIPCNIPEHDRTYQTKEVSPVKKRSLASIEIGDEI